MIAALRFDTRRFLVVICLVGLGIVLIGSGPARAAERQLFMSVLDGSGEAVLDLRAEEVLVLQNGANCEVKSIQPETDRMKIALLVDNSEGAADSLNSLRQGLTNFLNTLPPQHEIGLFTIASQVRRRVDFTTDRGELQEQVDTLFIDRNTRAAVLDGLLETWDRRFEDDDAWPVFVLVLHDGPEGSSVQQNPYNEFVMELRSRVATVHSILVNNQGGGLQSDVSRNLIDNTGGIYSPIVAANALPEVHTELATAMGAHYDEVRDRLRLVLECQDDTPGAAMTVRVQRQGLEVSLFFDRGRAQ